MRFFYPWMLLLVPLAAFLALAACWLLKRGNSRLGLMATPDLLKRVGLASSRTGGTVGFSAIPFVQLALLAAGLVLLGVAAARPQWGRADVHLKSHGRSLLVALDVSRSMLAADVHPNRLERAKVDILDLVADLKGDRAGVLVFRGKGLMLCPLTTDYAFLRQAVDGITIDSAPRGETDIADAINKCLEAFSDAPDDNNAILLISDGEDLAGRAKRAAEEAGRRNIPVFTVGIGDPTGAAVPSPDGNGTMKFGGHDVKSRLTESTLRDIASVSGGVYIPLATSGTAATTLGAIYRQHLTKIAARELEEMLENRHVERFQLFLVPALILLLAAAALSKGRPAPANRAGAAGAKAAGALVMAMLLLPGLAARADGDAPAASVPGQPATGRDAKVVYNEAVDAYLAGDATNAASLLLPLSANPDFPAAAELYGAAEFKKSFDPVLATNAAERVELLSGAARGFRTALAKNAGDERLQRNLYRATSALPVLRETAHVDAVLARHAQEQPPQLIARMLGEQRAVAEALRTLATNRSAAARISGLESLATRQRLVGDMWIPLKPALTNPQAVTNEQQRAMVGQMVEEARSAMDRAAQALEDVDEAAAVEPLALAENAAFGFWFMTAEPPGLIDEGILCETNVVDSPLKPKWPLREDNATALALSKSFSERFPEWAKQYIAQDAQRRQQEGSTNAPSFTEENVAKINELMEQLLWLQDYNCKTTNVADRVSGAREALSFLYKIRDLLPKDGGGSSSADQQQQQQAQNQQQEKQDEKQDRQQQEQQENQQNEERQDEEQESKPAEESKDEPPPDVEEALRKALQREREHEADKQRQRREYPMPPNSRDW